MTTNQKTNEFKSYSLFNDIEDTNLRNRNRAVVLANIAEDNTDRNTKRINVKGSTLILGYFNCVAEDDRSEVMTKFADNMKQRGFALVA
jgi:hypothetical protein